MTLQRNLVSETTIQDVKFSQAAIDGPYLVVTLQILAHMLDVTVDARQETISGSSEQRRYCSEYWTFRRGIGAVEPWVLSLIEQEDQFKLIS
jgi:predicted lipid-binding transport protein (Tim44 family)